MPLDMAAVLDGLRQTLDALPSQLSNLFGLNYRPMPGPTPVPPRPAFQGIQQALGFLGGQALGGMARGLAGVTPGLGRFTFQLVRAADLLRDMAALKSTLFSPGGFQPQSFASKLARSWAPLIGEIGKKLTGVLPAGTSLQDFVQQRSVVKVVQSTLGAIGFGRTMLGGSFLKNLLTPAVAGQLSAKLGQAQLFAMTPAFEGLVGKHVQSILTAEIGRAQKLLAPPAAIAGGFDWMAAAGLALKAAGVVGAVVGAGKALVDTFVNITRWGTRYAETVVHANEHLKLWNGQIFASYRTLAIGDLSREFRMARSTAGSTAELARAVNDMRESWQGWAEFQAELQNRTAGFGAGWSAEAGKFMSIIGDLNRSLLNVLDPTAGAIPNALGHMAARGALLMGAGMLPVPGGGLAAMLPALFGAQDAAQEARNKQFGDVWTTWIAFNKHRPFLMERRKFKPL